MNEKPWIIMAALVALVAAIYAPTLAYPFINLDDDRYVTENPQVQQPISLKALEWALTTEAVANWHPLTWVAHLIDYQLFGLWAGGHHLVNAAWHAANAALLFLVLRRATGAHGRSAVVAALFAVHPLHVESVAWIAERKDVLSAFFCLAALAAYVGFRKRTLSRYLLVVVALALALMAKPMAVTLPCVLLLMDYWPLQRWRAGSRNAEGGTRSLMALVVEKLPLFALAAFASVMTIHAQGGSGSLMSLERFPIGVRAANALAAYGTYALKTAWPTRLAIFYPHPGAAFNAIDVAAAAGFVAAATIGAVLARRRFPYVLVGWLWFLGTLVPVIGLLQVGMQAVADRYMYLPSIGLFLMIVWGAADAAAAWRAPRWMLPGAAALAIVALTAASIHQVRYWRDSVALFEHALAITKDNGLVHYNLGITLLHQGKPADALPHFQEAIRIDPKDPKPPLNYGTALVALGKPAEALPYFERVLAIDPDDAWAHYNEGTTLAALGRDAAAAPHLERAAQLDPNLAEARYNLGTSLYRLGRLDEAVAAFREALRLKPDYLDARVNLGNALTKLGAPDEAVAEYREVTRLAPNRMDAHYNLGFALFQQGKLEEAAQAFSQAVRIDPDNVQCRINLETVQQEIIRRKQRGDPR